MAPHGARAVPIAAVDGVMVYLRKRIHKVTQLDLELHSSVLPRDLHSVTELHYRFVNGNIIGEAKVWTYGYPQPETALILDYWCDIAELYVKLLKYVLDDLKIHYNVRTVYLHTVRTDETEKKLLGKTLRELNFVMIDNEYAVLALP